MAIIINKELDAIDGNTSDVIVNEAGDVLTYTMSVSSNETLNNVVVTDPLLNGPNGSGVTYVSGDDGDGLLEAGETWIYTGTYTVQQEDIDGNGIDANGAPDGDSDIDNIATVTAETATGVVRTDTDDETVLVLQTPSIDVVKANGGVVDLDANGDDAGDEIDYTYTVTNDGNVTLYNVTLFDNQLGPIALTGLTDEDGDGFVDDLAVGATATGAATATLDQADIDAGAVSNAAFGAGIDPNDDPVSDVDFNTVLIDQNPALNITKVVTDVGGDGAGGVVDAAGDVITYAIAVQNTGNTTLTGVTVTDTLDPTVTFVGGDTDADGALDVGETWTYSASYAATQADIDTDGGGDGDIDNTATADSAETGPDTASAAAPVLRTPALNITKVVTDVGGDGAGGVVDAAGDVITYAIAVQNTGNTTLTGVTVTDTLDPTVTFVGGDTDADGALDVGETWTYSASYAATQADIDTDGGGDGDIDNTATADSAETGPDTASAAAPVLRTPALNITKVVTDVGGDGAGGVVDAAGDVITYAIAVQNTGNTTLTGVTVTDTLDPTVTFVGGDTDADGALDVGETWTYSASYAATQADIDTDGGGDGDIDNTATADSAETGPDTASAAAPVLRTPALNITKVVTDVGGDGAGGVVDAAGDVITYAIAVQNTGNTTLTGVTVTDTLDPTVTFVGGDTDADGALDVGETWTYSASYAATQADIDTDGGGDGDIDNTATADSAETGPDTASAAAPVLRTPALNITKVVTDVGGDGAGGVVDAAGDVITYAIAVQNTGNTTLTGVTVTDTLDPTVTFVGGDTDADGALDVGETWTYSASYAATQADIDTDGGGDGDIDNTATADSAETGPDTASAAAPVLRTPALNITKVVTDVGGDGAGGVVDAAGDVITYAIAVQNTGNTTLTGVTVTDTLDPTVTFVGGDTDADGALDVGETWTYSASYAATQADIDTDGGGDGDIDNTATADSAETGPDTASAAAPVLRTPALNITKVVTDVGGDGAGGVVDAAGDVITYAIAVQNTGNTTLTGVTVTDTLDPTVTFVGGDTDADGALDVGETWTYSASYAATQADIDTDGGGDGDIDNTATADSAETGPDTASAAAPVLRTPALNITKVVTDVGGDGAGGVVDAAGDVITYAIAVQNTGNTTLTGVTVTDTLDPTVTFVGGDTDADGALDVGETWTYSASYAATQADIDTDGGGDGDIDNTATADSAETGPDTASAAAPVLRTPALNITKVVTDVGGDGAGGVVDAAGDVITYAIAVQNTGNTTLTGVTVTDTLDPTVTFVGGDTDADGALDVGETWTYSASYAATQADIDTDGGGDGDIDNTATADSAETGPDTASAAAPVLRTPALNITKVVTDVGGDGAGGVVDAAGDVITYAIAVQNTGNTTLTGVTVTDTLDPTVTFVGGDTDADGALDVGETWTYSASYAATQADIDTDGGGDGDIDNTATADSAETGPDTASAAAPVEQQGSLCVKKLVTDVDGYGACGVVDAAGDVITYKIIVKNTGDVGLTGVEVTDQVESNAATDATFVSGDTDGDGTLDVGETWIYSATYIVTQEDIDTRGGGDGDIDNTATAGADQADPASDSASVYLLYKPRVDIDKCVVDITNPDDTDGGWKADQAGDLITYAIKVKNTGNVTLTGVEVTDTLDPDVELVSGDTDGDGKLDVGETWIFEATYVVTQDDIDGAVGWCGDDKIINKATVDTNETPKDCDWAVVKIDPTIDICGYKFGDLNGDGDWDKGQGEHGLWGWKIQLWEDSSGDGQFGAGDTLVDWTYTGFHGSYHFDDVAVAGHTYFVKEVPKNGWEQTAPIDDADDTDGVSVVDGVYKIDIVSGSDSVGSLDFGNHKIEGPGTCSWGFWKNLCSPYWDAVLGNEGKGGKAGLPDGELLYKVDCTGDGVKDGVKGLLIGDYDKDGVQDEGEDVFFVSLTDARKILDAGKQSPDGRSTLAGDAVSTWLNYLAGNPVGHGDPGDGAWSPKECLDDAIDWLQVACGGTNASGFGKWAGGGSAVGTGSAAWKTGLETEIWHAGVESCGADLHKRLDAYNETGCIDGTFYAFDSNNVGGDQQFLQYNAMLKSAQEQHLI